MQHVIQTKNTKGMLWKKSGPEPDKDSHTHTVKHRATENENHSETSNKKTKCIDQPNKNTKKEFSEYIEICNWTESHSKTKQDNAKGNDHI